MSLEKWADPECPPTFLIHSIDDEGVPIANSYFAMALADAGVPHQLHSVPSGRHGWNLKTQKNHTTLIQQYFLAWLQSYWSDIL